MPVREKVYRTDYGTFAMSYETPNDLATLNRVLTKRCTSGEHFRGIPFSNSYFGLNWLDLGAHLGSSSVRMVTQYAAKQVKAFEPWHRNYKLAETNLKRNGLQTAVDLQQSAVGTYSGEVGFMVRKGDSSMVVDEGSEIVVQRDFYTLLDGIDCIKMDIEGSEIPILNDDRLELLQPLKLMMIEYHAGEDPDHTIFKKIMSRLQNLFGHVEHYPLDWRWITNIVAIN